MNEKDSVKSYWSNDIITQGNISPTFKVHKFLNTLYLLEYDDPNFKYCPINSEVYFYHFFSYFFKILNEKQRGKNFPFLFYRASCLCDFHAWFSRLDRVNRKTFLKSHELGLPGLCDIKNFTCCGKNDDVLMRHNDKFHAHVVHDIYFWLNNEFDVILSNNILLVNCTNHTF